MDYLIPVVHHILIRSRLPVEKLDKQSCLNAQGEDVKWVVEHLMG